MSNHYETLGLEKTATSAEIKAAYRKLAMKHHPDRNQGDGAKASEAKFKEIADAYETLIDPEKRAAYDFGKTVPNQSEIDMAAVRMLREMLEACMDSHNGADIVSHIAECVNIKARELRMMINVAEQDERRLSKWRKRLIHKGVGANLVEDIIAERSAKLAGRVINANVGLAVIAAVMPMLNDYEDLGQQRDYASYESTQAPRFLPGKS